MADVIRVGQIEASIGEDCTDIADLNQKPATDTYAVIYVLTFGGQRKKIFSVSGT